MTLSMLVPPTVMLSITLLAGVASQPVQQDAVPNNSLVTICHFDDHAGDFVTFNSASNPDGNPLCALRGGVAITIPSVACQNGHNAQQLFANRSCMNGDLQP